VHPLATFIERMMVRKSDAEVALIRESARWCEYAHRLLQKYSVLGATEGEAGLRALSHLGMRDADGHGIVGRDHHPAGDLGRAGDGVHALGCERNGDAKGQTAAGNAGADEEGTAIEFAAGRHH